MKSFLKSRIAALFPDLHHVISSYRFFLRCKKQFQAVQDEFAKSVYGDRIIEVLSGPFRGLAYFNKIVWGPVTPKWIGSYEEELHAVVGEIIETGYATIVDVGAAEGYYSVGLARSCPSANVISYDVSPIARKLQRELAAMNAITNLDVRKYCSHALLHESLCGRSVVICDIEGFEHELLDPGKVPSLGASDILVEIHPFGDLAAGAVKDSLIARFSASHDVRAIKSTRRDAAEYSGKVSGIGKIGLEAIAGALDEHRTESQEWLWMKARAN